MFLIPPPPPPPPVPPGHPDREAWLKRFAAYRQAWRAYCRARDRQALLEAGLVIALVTITLVVVVGMAILRVLAIGE